MKNSYLAMFIIFVIAAAYGTGLAHGELVPKTLGHLYQEYQGKLIIRGQIMSVSQNTAENLTSYDIKILDYITRPQQASVITAASQTENKTSPVFDVGDTVQLYLDRGLTGYEISPYSFKMDKKCSTWFGPSYLDFEPPHSAAASNTRFLGIDGNAINPSLDHEFVLTTDGVYTPLDSVRFEVYVNLNGNPNPIFHDTKRFSVQPCTYATPTWKYTPTEAGNYTLYYKVIGGIYQGKIILYNASMTTGFTIEKSNATQSPKNTANFIGNDLTPILPSPLEQFKSGIKAEDVKCNDGLLLVLKAEDKTPACIRPYSITALTERGWISAGEKVTPMAMTESMCNSPHPPTPNGYTCTVSNLPARADNQTTGENQTTGSFEIELANQTYEAGYQVDGMLNFTTMSPHCELPSFLVRNLSDQSIVFGPYPGWNYTNSICADHSPFSFYAGLEKNALVTHDQKYSLEAAIYGKKYEKEITVTPSEYSGKNITVESNSILPGFAPDFNCPAFLGSWSTDTILNSSGFDGIYHRYYIRISHSEEVDDYLLKPGHNGTIVLKVHRGSAFPKDQNLADGLGFFNSQSSNGNFGHEGVTATFSQNPAIAGPDDYATFDITISATPDAAHGTYWVYLPPGACGGGMPIFLTVGDKPLAQPPDLIGYDLSVDFSFSESPVLTVDVANPSIHTFDNCSLTDTAAENKTSVLGAFETMPPGFSYKYNFDSNPVKGDRVVFECTSPHVIRTYSPS